MKIWDELIQCLEKNLHLHKLMYKRKKDFKLMI